MKRTHKHTLIIGLGIIGASFALALRKAGICGAICGFDTNKDHLRHALNAGYIDCAADNPEIAAAAADFIVLAVPARAIPKYLQQLAPNIAAGAIIMDVGSTKREIVAEMDRLPEHIQAIGGHPMTGMATAGVTEPCAELFNGRIFFLIPTARATKHSLKWLQNVIIKIGAVPKIVNAQEHDRAAAMMSHLPHAAAILLMNTAGYSSISNIKDYIAGGFRTSAEKSADNPSMWADIFYTNKQEMISALEAYEQQLHQFSAMLEQEDSSKLLEYLQQAQSWWYEFANSEAQTPQPPQILGDT